MFDLYLLRFENIFTILFAIIGFAIVIYAQFKINKNYGKYSKIYAKTNKTGRDVARDILDKNGLSNVDVVMVDGVLSDHYDPTSKVVRLSRNIYSDNSIASISVAAHECGHAIQDKEGYLFMKIRSFLVPVVNFVSYLGYFGLIVSLIGGMSGYFKLSIIVLLATVLFQLITLPVEFDASKRGAKELISLNIVDNNEKNGVKNMLSAAAFTYVAGLISSILNLLRLILMLRDSEDD